MQNHDQLLSEWYGKEDTEENKAVLDNNTSKYVGLPNQSDAALKFDPYNSQRVQENMNSVDEDVK